MKFKMNPIKEFFLYYFKSNAARRFRIFGLFIIALSLGIFLFWDNEISWIAALAVLILFIPLWKKTLGSRTAWLGSEIEISSGMLIERHTTSLSTFKTLTVTQKVTSISAIYYYSKTGEIDVIGHNNMSSSDGYHNVIPSCYFKDCYGSELLKALEENYTAITYLKKGGIN